MGEVQSILTVLKQIDISVLESRYLLEFCPSNSRIFAKKSLYFLQKESVERIFSTGQARHFIWEKESQEILIEKNP